MTTPQNAAPEGPYKVEEISNEFSSMPAAVSVHGHIVVCETREEAGEYVSALNRAYAAGGETAKPKWQSVETAPRDGTPFFAGLWVRASKTYWFDKYYVWCDPETGNFEQDCYPGWDIGDFSFWCPVILPPTPPSPPEAGG